MFLELILSVSLIFLIFVLDYFSRTITVILCFPVVYYYFQYLCPIVQRRFITSLIRKVYIFFSTIFSFRKLTVSHSSITNADSSDSKNNLENEINELVSKISLHYIESWYSQIGDNKEFLKFINSSVKEILLCLCTRVSNADKRKFFRTILHIYRHFFSHYLQAREKSEDFNWNRFKMKHWAVKDSSTEWCYLQSLVSEVIDIFGPYDCDRSLHSKTSPLIHSIIVEILTENIISHVVRFLTNPSSINSLIIKLLLNGAENKKTGNSVSKLHNIPIITNSTILTHADDSSTEALNSPMKPQPIFTIPHDVSNYATGIVSNLARGKCDNIDQSEFTSIASSSIKSSSNGNLSEGSSILNKDVNSLTCDIKMKRSRSADFIRQMPHLKALNLKDYIITLQKEDKMTIAFKSDKTLNNIEQAEEAIEIEVPTLFSEVKITGTVQETENGIFPYTLYCIQCSALFHDTEKPEIPHFVKQVITVKRRFSEFLALQTRLESDPSLKYHLKGVKGPSKGIQFPFSNLDKKNVAERKIFLENYLKKLCSIAPISQSYELQEFLGYGNLSSNSEVSFIRKNDIFVPRIDKMLVRGVKGAIDIIKIALPLEGDNPNISKAPIEDSNVVEKFHEYLTDFSSRDPEIKDCIHQYFNNNVEISPEDCLDDFDCTELDYRKVPFHKVIGSNTFKCCKSSLNDIPLEDEECPIGNSLFELMFMATNAQELNIETFFPIIKLLFSPCLDKYFTDKINSFSEDDIASFLNFLQKFLWPKETESQFPIVNANVDQIMEYLEEYLSTKGLYGFGFFHKSLLDAIYLFLASIQNQESNKYLVFQVLDAVLEVL